MSTSDYYKRFRIMGGMNAKQALRAAKILSRWKERECGKHDEPKIGSVRLIAEPEDEPYDAGDCRDAYTNQFGRRVSAEQASKELDELLERNGNWWTRSEYFDGEEWKHADSIGHCAGYVDVLSPFENWYIVDLMDTALDAVDALATEPACMV